jgi:hypothetical protein
MGRKDVLEFAIWVGLIATRVITRVAQVVLEWLFVAATWIALFVIGVVMAFQRSGLPWSDPSDARATSTSPGSTTRRAPLR